MKFNFSIIDSRDILVVVGRGMREVAYFLLLISRGF